MKIFSLNIEGDKHLESIFTYLKDKNMDVVCFQEVFKIDQSLIEEKLQMTSFFVPLSIIGQNSFGLSPKGKSGLLMLTKRPEIAFSYQYYTKHSKGIPNLIGHQPNSGDRALLWAKIKLNHQEIIVSTTHFTWSPDGETTDEQRESLLKLLAITQNFNRPFILCGDFNAPRGREIFDLLASQLTDHIPPDVKTTIDGKFHRAGGLKLVVDGFFSSKQFSDQVSSVKLIDNLSDHLAVEAQIGY
jgi:endonuclease/exonuclease/phosphatase family metal-dependent hydrolase